MYNRDIQLLKKKGKRDFNMTESNPKNIEYKYLRIKEVINVHQKKEIYINVSTYGCVIESGQIVDVIDGETFYKVYDFKEAANFLKKMKDQKQYITLTEYQFNQLNRLFHENIYAFMNFHSVISSSDPNIENK